MTLSEAFTWFNVAVLALGSVAVFSLFMRQLPLILRPPDSPDGAKPRDDEIRGAD